MYRRYHYLAWHDDQGKLMSLGFTPRPSTPSDEALWANRGIQIMATPFDNMNGYEFVLPNFRSVPHSSRFEMNATCFQVCKPAAAET